MLFNSYFFLLLFFPATFLIYHLLVRLGKFTLSKAFLVAASLYFYGYFKPSYIVILIASILLNYLICTRIWSQAEKGCSKNILCKLLLACGCLLNVGILVYYKYTGFLLENLNFFFGTKFGAFSILLPLGISFYTFQQLSFLIDAYKGDNLKIDLVDYSLFVTFFPQLIAGPIVLPGEMLPQFEDHSKRRLSWENMNTGLWFFACGLVKKCFVADTIAIIVNTGFGATSQLNVAEAWLAGIGFVFQMYFDFSGYCDMAMGIGKFFNIDLPLNFNSPLKANCFQDFWRRWHITLGRFMTQYLYFPLGGSRCSKPRALLNMVIVFVVSGIWHGAGWVYLLWGTFHGLCLLINRVWSDFTKKHPAFKIPLIPSIILTFFLQALLGILFRAQSFSKTWQILCQMFDFRHIAWMSKPFGKAIEDYGFDRDFIIITYFAAAFTAFFLPNSFEMNDKLKNRPMLKMWITVIFLTVGFISVGRISPFLYFNF